MYSCARQSCHCSCVLDSGAGVEKRIGHHIGSISCQPEAVVLEHARTCDRGHFFLRRNDLAIHCAIWKGDVQHGAF